MNHVVICWNLLESVLPPSSCAITTIQSFVKAIRSPSDAHLDKAQNIMLNTKHGKYSMDEVEMVKQTASSAADNATEILLTAKTVNVPERQREG